MNDGLKWFNWLYMTVTEAIENKVAGGGFNDPAWLSELDVLFARLYFEAIAGDLSGGPCPDCWQSGGCANPDYGRRGPRKYWERLTGSLRLLRKTAHN